ncbi:hypothetical protein EXIGLDRAFT_747110 [Exidia glandulosa HHB12029]|uniref:Cupredoxin n=1 Tax=Exidia glandulosa HHB12029 TaxID=1314781 RepID=A0A165L485_EXIGL|nr:hypothetical protein EXIGLDRAFT_747110 [Exidia glandulosa HHB12029]
MRFLALALVFTASAAAASTPLGILNHFVAADSPDLKYSGSPAPYNLNGTVPCHRQSASFNITSARIVPPNTSVTFTFNGTALFPIIVSPSAPSADGNAQCSGRFSVGKDINSLDASNSLPFEQIEPEPGTGWLKCDLPTGRTSFDGESDTATVVLTADDCDLHFAGFVYETEVTVDGGAGPVSVSLGAALGSVLVGLLALV